ncbi:MAG: thiol:disulfide interchange protein, partial [Sphingomonadales bacterium]
MLLIAVLAWAGALHAQNNISANNISAELVLIESRDGGREEVYAMHFRPQEGWHGYWSNPGDAGLGMQTEWSWPAEWFGTPQYPVPHQLTIAGLMNHVYEDDYAVLIPVSIPADVAGDDFGPLSVKAQWLACTDQICVPEEAELTARVALASDDVAMWRAAIAPPLDSQSSFEMVDGKLRLAIPIPANMALSQPHIFVETLRVVDYAADQTFRRQGDILTIEIPLKGTAEPGEIEGILSLGGGNGVHFKAIPGDVPEGGELISTTPGESPAIWVLLLGAMAGGLVLNIMPCVFPILSLKAISLARAGESQAQARGEGLAYTAGVVLACVALGGVMLALRAAGEQVGWAFQLQEPGVVVFLLVLAVAITANLAGLFELPQLSVTRSGEPASAFATGLLAAFVATPCTGPFMAAALGAALLLPPVQALALFA